ncbi:hypothetical protein CDS [Bradyrhizobium sp.]|nr:hypothetical protein CDS [Bradyrhizobium sp.]
MSNLRISHPLFVALAYLVLARSHQLRHTSFAFWRTFRATLRHV